MQMMIQMYIHDPRGIPTYRASNDALINLSMDMYDYLNTDLRKGPCVFSVNCYATPTINNCVYIYIYIMCL